MALYHSARGSVNYTIVGSPTIVDSVVSGFSADDYLVTTQQFSSISPEKLELQAKFTPTNLNNTYQYIVSYQTTGGLNGGKSGFRINSNNRLQYKIGYYSDSSGDFLVTSSANIQVNSSIIAKGYYIGDGVYGLDVSTDGGNTWVIDTVTIDSSKTIELNSSYGTYIGRTSTAGTNINVFSGSIDLKHTYIKVDGQPWFGICPVEVKKHQIMGPVGYTVVGSPIIVDGVVSNFSLSSYVQIPAFMPGNKTWALQLKFKLNSSMTNSSALFNDTSNDFRCPKVTVIPGTSSLVFRAFVSTTGSSWNVSNGPQRSVSFDYSKWAYILWEFTGSQYILSFKQEGQDYSIIKTINSTEPFYQNQNQVGMSFGNDIGSAAQYNSYIDGSIDLNETYIKVNGKLWFWQPQETKYVVKDGKLVWADPDLYLAGPVNYTVVGSPTITDGVASGFSGSNYLQSSSTFPGSTATSLEFATKFNISSFASTSTIASSTTNIIPFHLAVRDSKFRLYPGRENTYKVGDFVLSANTDYFIKLIWDSTNGWKLQYSTDGTNYTTDFENYNPSDSAPKDNYIILGRNFPNGGQEGLLGTLDLNHTYIKVNGSLWFYGKNYAYSNIAPVPAGYPLGNTTTPSIGWVDMRTQTFTASPTGATLTKEVIEES